MGLTKTSDFSKDQNEIAAAFKALGHPARIAIVQHLLKTKGCICGDLVDVLPLAQATVSQHLRELKQVGIIKGSIDANKVCYCLDEKGIALIQSFSSILKADCESDCC